MTHAAQLIQAIRAAGRRGMTYGELQDLHISTSPQKRISESGHKWLRKGERMARVTGRDGLVRFVVKRGCAQVSIV